MLSQAKTRREKKPQKYYLQTSKLNHINICDDYTYKHGTKLHSDNFSVPLVTYICAHASLHAHIYTPSTLLSQLPPVLPSWLWRFYWQSKKWVFSEALKDWIESFPDASRQGISEGGSNIPEGMLVRLLCLGIPRPENIKERFKCWPDRARRGVKMKKFRKERFRELMDIMWKSEVY